MSAAAMPKIIYGSITERNKLLPETTLDLTGRVIVITGANVGLGLESAKRFYAMNPSRLILAVRAVSKGEEAKKSIIESLEGTSSTSVEVWELDLASFASVKAFASRCETQLERLDILLENSGIISGSWSITKDGWETGLQVNVLSTFLLAGLLTPLLAKTAKLPATAGSYLRPHLVVVSSDLHQVVPLSERKKLDIFRNLNTESQYKQSERYPTTKLLDLLLTEELAKVPQLSDVIVCSVNPGFCRSELMRDSPSIPRRLGYALMARSTAEGSKTYTWAALTNDIPSGSYTSSCKVVKPSGVAARRDATQICSRLWEEIGVILGKEAPTTEAIWMA